MESISLVSSDEEDTRPVASSSSPSKVVAKKSKAKAPIKRKSTAIESSDEDDDGDDYKMKKKRASSSSSDGDSDVKSSGKKSKKVPVAKVGSKPPAKAVKKPAAKKTKKKDDSDDGEEEPAKPKWVFKPKTGPANPERFEEPEGRENCLEGLIFVFTGELTTMSREQGTDLVKRYGGRVTTAPSGKTSYVVVGTDAGPKKLEMIAKKGIKTLTEDQFMLLINQRPAGAVDEKFLAKKKEEEKKIVLEAKKMGLAKDAPEHQTELWTTKYAPTALSQICGNKGMVAKLTAWLDAWHESARCNFKKPGKDLTGSFRAILISGPPGIGKTTAAHLVAKLAGYDILELNASDTRSKKLLESAFSDTINNTRLDGFFKGDAGTDDMAAPSITKKTIIIMDEVDGMSAGDRGGVGALNMLIKKTRVPIIAICNDKSNPKMKPLMSTCFQMTFKRPNANEIRSRMMSIAYQENVKVDGKALDQLVAGSQSDIRQIVNMLSTWKLTAKTLDFDAGKAFAKANEKNQIQTPWSLYSKLFGPQAFSAVSGMTFADKMDLYFNDFSLMPLFVQDNYLGANFSRANTSGSGEEKALKELELAAAAAESISDGDLVDQMIHGSQQWSLLPVHGVFSCVSPGYYCHGSGSRPGNPNTGGFGGPSFPAWFGKNSTQTKMKRLLGEIQIRMRLRISGDRKEIRQSYIPTLFARIVVPLQERGVDAIDEVIQIMDDYFLTKEDWDALVDLGVGKSFRGEGVLKLIPSNTKSAFTRKYNKSNHPIPFYKTTDAKITKKLAGGPAPDQEDVLLEDDDGASDDEGSNAGEEGDYGLSKDKMIKQKAKKAPAKSRSKAAKEETESD